MGLMAVRFGELMREPVTMTSSSPEVAGVVATAACCAQAAGTTAVAVAAASAARTANCNLRLIPIGWSLTIKYLGSTRRPAPFAEMRGLNHVDPLLPTRRNRIFRSGGNFSQNPPSKLYTARKLGITRDVHPAANTCVAPRGATIRLPAKLIRARYGGFTAKYAAFRRYQAAAGRHKAWRGEGLER